MAQAVKGLQYKPVVLSLIPRSMLHIQTKMGMVAHTCNSRAWNVQTERDLVLVQ